MFFSSSLNPQAGAKEDDLPWWPLAVRDDVLLGSPKNDELLGSPKERQEWLNQARPEQQEQEQEEEQQEQEQKQPGGPSYSHWPALAL